MEFHTSLTVEVISGVGFINSLVYVKRDEKTVYIQELFCTKFGHPFFCYMIKRAKKQKYKGHGSRGDLFGHNKL